MWTASFWKQVAERGIKSAAQALIGLWVGDAAFNVWQADPRKALGVAVGAFILSLLTSLVSAPVGEPGTPSLVETPSEPEAPPITRRL
jgi:hypothetical protein